MQIGSFFKELKRKDHPRLLGGLEIFRYIGPGLLVTVGFIDPGNWASNFAAGSQYGYALLWVVTLSTVMLIMLQHNVAHLGIATGLCLSGRPPRSTLPHGSVVRFFAPPYVQAFLRRWPRYSEVRLRCKCYSAFPLCAARCLPRRLLQ